MKRTVHLLITAWLLALATAAAEPGLTIYNQDFAVVRETVRLDLKPGANQVRFAGTTAYLEPSSVILRDPSGEHAIQILEQNFRADLLSLESLLALNEGKTIEFEVINQEAGQTRRELIPGKIVRSGGDLRFPGAAAYGYTYYSMGSQPIIEVSGNLRFSLPGQPLFPSLGDDTILKPTLLWVIETQQEAKFDAELSYLTGGMRWDADYNLVLAEQGDDLDLVGWVTMENQSGKTFKKARIKLMAGDVNKIQAVGGFQRQRPGGGGGGGRPPVTEKTFDEYHLYSLERPATLLDREKKQVEFVRAAGVHSTALYIYDGADIDLGHLVPDAPRTDTEYGAQCNKKISVMRQFTNSAANHLGLPLPKGNVRFYRRNTDGQMEFTGENVIDHTPRDELVRLSIGNAFDLVGERKQTEFNINVGNLAGRVAIDAATGLPVLLPSATNIVAAPWINESIEITLRNHKKKAVEVRVVEHLYRWINWEITRKSSPYRKTDSQTVEFPVQLEPDGEQRVTYTVHYSW